MNTRFISQACHLSLLLLRGHLWEKTKWPYKTDDLKRFNSYEISMTGQEKGDLLTQVTV